MRGQEQADKGLPSKLALEEAVSFYGFAEESIKAEKLSAYLGLLEEMRLWGGLVSRGLKDRLLGAVCESLAVAAALERVEGSIADIGSGGGLLGIPIAVAIPGSAITLIESLSRKAAFLAEAAGRLQLGNVRVDRSRTEELLGKVEFVATVSRAAGKLESIAPSALGLLSTGGVYIALKSTRLEDEIAAARPSIERAGGQFLDARAVVYPPSAEGRGGASLVVIEKL